MPKETLPDPAAAIEKRSGSQPPRHVYRDGADRVELWEAEDFDRWETVAWPTVRVIRYRQHKPDGSWVQAGWLTNFPSRRAGSLSLYRMAKSRWEIENQACNDAQNRYGLGHLWHHGADGVLVNRRLTLLPLVIERLYRLRYLHRGTHPVRSAEQVCLLLWVSLSRPCPADRN